MNFQLSLSYVIGPIRTGGESVDEVGHAVTQWMYSHRCTRTDKVKLSQHDRGVPWQISSGRVQTQLKHSGIRPKTIQIAFSEHAHVRLLHESDRHVGVPTGRHRRLI